MADRYPADPIPMGEGGVMDQAALLSSTDASVWAEEFVRMHGGDQDLMVSWFANAMMAYHDHGPIRVPDGAVERLAGRLSTEPPYEHEHPQTLVPLAQALLDAALDDA